MEEENITKEALEKARKEAHFSTQAKAASFLGGCACKLSAVAL